MQIQFNKIAHGPAWERWVIVEDQHGDPAYAGQVVFTYSDTTSEAIFDCDVIFLRDLSDGEIDELLDALSTLVCGDGDATIYAADEIISKSFCPHDAEHPDDSLN